MKKKTILIVSPHEHTRKPLFDIFSGEGYTVFTASSGQEGLEVFIKERPSLSIIEQVMPVMNGFETLRRFKEVRPETPVIMLTSHGTIDAAIEAIKMGAFDYIPKPPELAHLINTVKRALDATKSS